MRLSQVILASLLFFATLGAAAATEDINGSAATEGAGAASESAVPTDAAAADASEEASRFVCTSGDSERVIEVVYRNPDQSLPCEVRYHKDGAEETLWRAQNEEGFCEQQAQEFAADQQQWGWECDEAHDADTGDTQRQ